MSASTSAAAAAAEARDEKSARARIAELKTRVLIGELPDDFLRLTTPLHDDGERSVHSPSQQLPAHPQQQQYTPQMQPFYFVPPHTRGRLAIKVVEAKLTKNYGLVRMDPYVRVRIGNTIFETPTSVNGGKSPSWNRTINSYLPNDLESIYLQVFDERAFTNDECVGWAHVILPEGIFNNETIDDWYSLSGPQGEGKEGVINLVMSFVPIETPAQHPQQGAQGEHQQLDPATLAAQQQPLFTEEEINELHVMFPSIDGDVIRSVLEAKGGDKDSTVTALIEMAN